MRAGQASRDLSSRESLLWLTASLSPPPSCGHAEVAPPAGQAGEGAGAGSQLHVAVPVDPGDLHLERAVGFPAHGSREPYQRPDVDVWTELRQVASGSQVRRRRGKDVPPGEGGAGRRQLVFKVVELDSQRRPAQGVYGRDDEAVVGADEDDVCRLSPHRHPPAVCPHPGVDDGDHDAGGQVRRRSFQGQAAGSDVLRPYVVGEVDDRDLGEAGSKHAVQGSDEAVGQPVVR